MRRGLLKELDAVFDDARMMVRGTHNSDAFDAEDARLNALQKEVRALVREGAASLRESEEDEQREQRGDLQVTVRRVKCGPWGCR